MLAVFAGAAIARAPAMKVDTVLKVNPQTLL